ncbi:hypothetical protein BDZ91DRAFT_851399 [Kalaharituber pfeilii]|nr:hypothetical protein BDZ91DRAFT_851399 [Kalaharituber pfeilii]
MHQGHRIVDIENPLSPPSNTYMDPIHINVDPSDTGVLFHQSTIDIKPVIEQVFQKANDMMTLTSYLESSLSSLNLQTRPESFDHLMVRVMDLQDLLMNLRAILGVNCETRVKGNHIMTSLNLPWEPPTAAMTSSVWDFSYNGAYNGMDVPRPNLSGRPQTLENGYNILEPEISLVRNNSEMNMRTAYMNLQTDLEDMRIRAQRLPAALRSSQTIHENPTNNREGSLSPSTQETATSPGRQPKSCIYSCPFQNCTSSPKRSDNLRDHIRRVHGFQIPAEQTLREWLAELSGQCRN